MRLSVMPLSTCEHVKSDMGAGIAFISDVAFHSIFENEEDLLFAIRIKNSEDDDTKNIIMTCIPIDEEDTIYLPEWAIDYLQSSIVYVEHVDLNGIPRAKTIKAKVIDNELYHTDIRDHLEEILYDFKFIQANIILTIYLECMGNYPAQIWIESIIDQDGIECIGSASLSEEVELDLSEPFEKVPEFEPVEDIPDIASLVPDPVVPDPPILKATKEQQRLAREARLKYFNP